MMQRQPLTLLPTLRRAALAVALLCGGPPTVASAEEAPSVAESVPEEAATDDVSPAPSADEHQHPEHIEEIVVTAPLARTVNELAKPVVVMTEDEIRQSLAPQVGAVLGNLPGVSQSYFGPGSSRPVIRGLAGDNIRVVENGLSLLDASSVSPDHAVAIDPMLIRRAEVVRGPSALLYGPNAIGGVVNLTTRRLPDVPMEDMVTGAVLGRGNSVDSEGAGVAYLEGGYRGFALHANGFGRRTDNVSIPGFARSASLRQQEPLPPDESEVKDELINTWIKTHGGGGGVAYHWDGGYFGLSPEFYSSEYGLAGTESTFVELEQTRFDIAGALDEPLPGVKSVSSRLNLSDYRHDELEATTRGDVVGTRFENRGYDLRIDAVQTPIAGIEGAFGFESYYSDFDASGAEAFFPRSKTTVQSLFAFEEIVLGRTRLQASGRLDISSAKAAESPLFGPADSRDFVTGGGSVGAVVTPVEAYALSANLAYVQRPPNAAELYADGPHLATAQYEIGDRDLSVQESLGFEVVARKEAGRVTGSIGGYYNRIDNFIDLIPTGEFFDTAELGHSHGGDPIIPIFQFENVPAEFIGTEAAATIHAIEASTYDVHVNLQADYVFARNRSTGEALPYLPPLRLGSEVVLHWKALSADASLMWSARQDETPDSIAPTDDFFMLNLGASYRIPMRIGTFDVFLRGNNLLNQTARLSTSTRKEFAPLPGAGVSGGVLYSF